MEPARVVAVGHDQAPDARTLAAFGLAYEEPVRLPYGRHTYRVGNAVLKHPDGGSAEVFRWDADLRAGLREDGFRIARPLPIRGGGWLTEDCWSASAFLDGGHDYRQQVGACVVAIERYHAALQAQPRPAFFDTLSGPFRRADQHAFGDRPARVHPDLEAQVDALYAIRQPLVGIEDQLIHGDLNPSNLLVADGQPPGIIDIAPYWRPAGFALAVFAYWIGPWRNRQDLLAHFAHVDQFEQLLVRAGIRMLLIMSELWMSELWRLQDMGWYARASRMILERHGR